MWWVRKLPLKSSGVRRACKSIQALKDPANRVGTWLDVKKLRSCKSSMKPIPRTRNMSSEWRGYSSTEDTCVSSPSH
jgi:hypothetical protein